VVRCLAAEAGIRRFLHIGTGQRTWVSNVFYGGVLVIAVTITTLPRRRRS
jgi:hypothetical protein